MSRDIFDAIPSWAVFLLTCVVILGALEFGYRLARWRKKAVTTDQNAPIGVATGAILGLVSFLLAFTFGIAASHYDARKATVLEEANAIGTAHLRADFLPEAQKAEAAALLRDYTQLRLSAALARVNRQEYDEVVRRSEEIHGKLWRLVVSNAATDPTPVSALLVSAVNDVIDVHSKRITHGVHNRIPMAIWLGLYAVSCVGIASAAYRISQSANKRSDMLPALTFAFAAVMTLIADLDDPRHGFLLNDQAPLQATLTIFDAGN